MKSAEQFLANLHRGISTPSMFTHNNNVLPPEVEFAASRGLKLAPVKGLGRFASAAHALFGYPTSDLVQLRCFASEFTVSQWSMTTTDGAIVLEYDPALGRHSLCELCDDWDGCWYQTLQFCSGSGPSATRFLLFRHDGQKLRVLGPRSAGLCLHAGVQDMVIVPPSCLRPQLHWANPSAVIEEVPWFLLDQDGSADGNPPAAVPAFPPIAGAPHELRYVYDDFSS